MKKLLYKAIGKTALIIFYIGFALLKLAGMIAKQDSMYYLTEKPPIGGKPSGFTIDFIWVNRTVNR